MITVRQAAPSTPVCARPGNSRDDRTHMNCKGQVLRHLTFSFAFRECVNLVQPMRYSMVVRGAITGLNKMEVPLRQLVLSSVGTD
jgi:hypothetical protein